MPEWSAARSWGTIGLLSALFSLGMATRSKVANGAPLPTPEEASFLANTNSHRANNRGLARLAARGGWQSSHGDPVRGETCSSAVIEDTIQTRYCCPTHC